MVDDRRASHWVEFVPLRCVSAMVSWGAEFPHALGHADQCFLLLAYDFTLGITRERSGFNRVARLNVILLAVMYAILWAGSEVVQSILLKMSKNSLQFGARYITSN